MRKDWIKLQQRAESQGWRVVRTPSNHFKWFPPNGSRILVSGCSPSDHRAFQNHLSNMRRGGFNDEL